MRIGYFVQHTDQILKFGVFIYLFIQFLLQNGYNKCIMRKTYVQIIKKYILASAAGWIVTLMMQRSS